MEHEQDSGNKSHPKEVERHRRRSPFDYGELRLIVLAMTAERPRHGYELMKMIEERMGGGYSPSPGVIYPTLSWLEDMGYAVAEAEGGRKRYRATTEGEAFLAANRAGLAEIAVHTGASSPRGDTPEAVLKGLDAVKRALRALFAGPVDEAAIARIASTLQATARAIEDTTAAPAEPGRTLRSVAEVSVPEAQSCLTQLCAHFARRASVHLDGNTGKVTFSVGACHFVADAGVLRMDVEAASLEGLDRVEDVVARHLLRFALPREPKIDWKRT